MSTLDHTSYVDQVELMASVKSSEPDSPRMLTTLISVCIIMFIVVFNYTVFNFTIDSINAVLLPADGDASTTKVLSTALVISGFIGAPIGSWFYGRMGDNKGRIKALYYSIALFVASAIVATCLPTYAQVGLLAPALLIMIRFLQGAAMGIPLHFGGVYLVESLPKSKQAFFMSISGASSILGLIACSNIFFWLQSYLTPEHLLTYGWRLMFVVGALLSIFALRLVKTLNETPLFLQASSHGLSDNSYKANDDLCQDKHYKTIKSKPMSDVSLNQGTNRFNIIFLAMCLALIDSSLAFIIIILLPEFLIVRFSIDPDLLHTAHSMSMVGLMVGMVFYGWLNDKIGAAKALILGSIVLGIIIMGFYNYCAYSDLTYLVPLYGLLGFASGMISITLNILVRLFKVSNRLTMTTFIYNSVSVVTGAILPLVLLFVVEFISFAPALYIVFVSLLSFTVGYYFYQSPNMYQLEELPQEYG